MMPPAKSSEQDHAESTRSLPISEALPVYAMGNVEKSFGVRRAEAQIKQYNKKYQKVLIFLAIFVMAYVFRLDAAVRKTFQTYATNSYKAHSLVSTVSTVRSVAAVCALIIYGRCCDIFGRMEILCVSLLLYAVGSVIESQAYTVTRFAAGAILYQIGLTGIQICTLVITADFSNLNWRTFCVFIDAMPLIINTWISGNVVSSIGEENWSWGIGMWAIIMPVAGLPLVLMLVHMRYLAVRNGDLHEELQRPRMNSKQFWLDLWNILLWQLDAVGVLGAALVIGLFLTPFTLAGGEDRQWRTAKVIVPLVLSGLLLPLVVLWESKYATHPILTRKIVKHRSVIPALVIGFWSSVAWELEGEYLYTVLVVAFHQSVKAATRIASLFSFSAALGGVFLGLVIVVVRKMKLIMFAGIGISFIAYGLMYRYRTGEAYVGGMIAGQVLLGIGSAGYTHQVRVSLQSYVNHEYLANVTALYSAMTSLGSAVGSSIAGAIWTQVLPGQIAKKMQNSQMAALAYQAPLKFITKHAWGSEARIQLVESYDYVQRIFLIIALCFCVPILALMFLIEDPKLKSVTSLELEEKYEK
ncbi:hypothetical protein KL935_004817 [Ogataea polymorpha]|uniref:Major facilitator superfamily (MFS) profile domain-containing protein n=2 Tax=Ogataea polymorpha TaxID=460523 RepID=A0A9P8P982_9ASCO|nr:hypothetical protein KL937_004798 [Ogataea polymorpha]KAG7889067.1 hypothetical protein KL908_004867 [Ogataea polymorpha]KAG7897942.1 hypothetical protein KL935_004817 [Ogataea polymorpha]KAG7931932.1 hypothetical protein KL904_004679 [Ogataea polymorpha]KAH3667712.1 hypothetical protein OGATHE_003235 [Ogataea polymorpha]